MKAIQGYHLIKPADLSWQTSRMMQIPNADFLERTKSEILETRDFGGEPCREPSVIGWMPSAQIYFRDPDGHSLEFITLLPDAPNFGFNGSYTKWKK